MNRLIAILLIPFFVVGNALAHSHSGGPHQSQGQTRAHIHVGGGSHAHSHHSHQHDHDHQHHDHNGEEPDSTSDVPDEHDSDAVYLVADSFFTTSERCVLDCDSQFVHATAECIITLANGAPDLIAPPFFCSSALPLYLLHAALRL